MPARALPVLAALAAALLLHTTVATLPQAQLNALKDIFIALNGSQSLLYSWNFSTDPCLAQWTGVGCNTQSTTVVYVCHAACACLSEAELLSRPPAVRCT